MTLLTDLGWRFDPSEPRDIQGRWTRTGHGYVLPDTNRLSIPRPAHPTKPYYAHPRDHPFFAAHPVSAKHIVDAFDQATPDDVAQGMRWYADAHTLAKAIGHGDITKGAGLLASYSPQSPWPVNMFNAARAMELGHALGPGEGMITGAMQHHAANAMNGESTDENFGRGAPKIHAFAKLIENGGDAPDDTMGQVVLDRHAMSVAMNERLTKASAAAAPIGKERYYQHVADAYRQAALEISARGTPIAPHQVQAITWLRQQRRNAEEDKAGAEGYGGKGAGKGRQEMVKRAWGRWRQEALAEELPVVYGTTEMTGTITGQLFDLAAWEHERRAPDGRWIRGGDHLQARAHVPTKDEIASEDIRSTLDQEWYAATPNEYGYGGHPQVIDHMNKAKAYWGVDDRDGAVDEVRTASLWYDNDGNEAAGDRLRSLATRMAGLHKPVPRHTETPPGPAEFDPHLANISTAVKAKVQAEIQRDMDIQARTVPGIAAHQKVIIAPLVPDDGGDGTAQGETMPDGAIYLKADASASIGGAAHARSMGREQVRNNFWTPFDRQYNAADHDMAHETGHVVGLHLGQKVLKDPEYWGPIAKAIGILPPPTHTTAGGKEQISVNDLADWADRNSYALEQGVSIYGVSSPFEMQADLWAEFTLSSHPRPAAVAFGEYALAHLPAADLPAKKATA